MPCYHPIDAYKPDDGGRLTFHDKGGRPIQIPCGRCTGCKLDRALDWSARLTHENQLHKTSCFLTLTYNDEHNPKTLLYRHHQLFLKRLRKLNRNLRFYCVGEYGEQTWRPHFHTILFGEDFFSDRKIYTTEPNTLWESETLNKLWQKGNCLIGAVTPETIGYVARYAMKKINGSKAEEHYTRVDPETGELIYLTPELSRMSLKPGIGAYWYDKYSNDIHTHDAVVNRGGFKQKIPKYYMDKFGTMHPLEHDAVKHQRFLKAEKSTDNTPERLAVREKVAKARLNHYTTRKL